MYRIKNLLNLASTGQTIIEAIVALSTILVILAAITIAITSSVNNSHFIKNQSQASKYAQQAMESLRYARNNDPNTFNSYSGVYCIGIHNVLDTYGAGGCSVNIPEASLIREVQFAQNSGSCSGGKLVTVKVYWSSGKCDSATLATRYCHKTEIVSCLSRESQSGVSL